MFTNQSEAGFRSEAGKQPQQANFRNALYRTVGRHLEGLLLTYATTLSETVSPSSPASPAAASGRPNRSYPRVSHKPVNKWRSRKSAPAPLSA